ncbi:UvrB/UvrC motif-containing protein [Bythopirellula goksoeyrii]|nr:UvrB/UvrC motif-containing protein [Bythopirellula goksoeyrii]
MNIHDQTHHIGKVPKRCPKGADQQTQLIRLRREMKEAISSENYERASQIRDEIRAIETQAQSPENGGEKEESD